MPQNINKMNNYLSPQFIECRPQHMRLEIQGVAWDKHKILRVKLDDLIPNDDTDINKQ